MENLKISGRSRIVDSPKFFIPDSTESFIEGSRVLMEERKCVKCGAILTDEDVMKIKKEDGSWEEIPLSVCPDCFTKQMRQQARTKTSRK